jgi:hypothetical protein
VVLDASAMSWAKLQNIDTKKLKAAKVPLYGKWYFPEIPGGVPLINLETGERHVFPPGMVAGEVIWAPEADLRRLGIAGLPEPEPEPEPVSPAGSASPVPTPEPEPLLMMVRPPEPLAEAVAPTTALARVEPEAPPPPPAQALGVHMPLASIAPFVLALGLCLVFLGMITTPVVLVVGLIWMLAGAIGWVRIGLIEYAAAHPHAVAHEAAEQP